MLPTFFVIGATKAGTTSLYTYLNLHPEIHMSPVKETHFFAGPENGFPYPRNRVERLEDYERLFESPLAVRGEASPSYSQHARRQGVPERIKELVPDARFVYIVRDPIARTVSHYQHWVALEAESRSLAEVLADADDPTNLFTCGSRYATQLERYLGSFPASAVLVVDQSDLLADRQATLSEIFAFLDVDPAFSTADFERELNTAEGRRVYGRRYAQIRDGLAGGALRRLPSPVRRQARRALGRFESSLFPPLERPQLDDELRARLVELYAPEVERLRSLTGKRFPSWSF